MIKGASQRKSNRVAEAGNINIYLRKFKNAPFTAEMKYAINKQGKTGGQKANDMA